MKTANSEVQNEGPKWPDRAATIVAAIGVLGIIVMLVAADSLFAHLTLEQTKKFSENWVIGIGEIAGSLFLYGFIVRKARRAKNARRDLK